MFDEEPDGDPHGECAFEIHRLNSAVAKKDEEIARLTKERDDAVSLNQLYHKTRKEHRDFAKNAQEQRDECLRESQTLRTLHDEIIDTMEKRGYFHAGNGEAIGYALDELNAERDTLKAELAQLREERDELVAQFGRIGEMIGDPLGGDFCQLEEAIREMVVFHDHVMHVTDCMTTEGAVEWLRGAKNSENDLITIAAERDALRARAEALESELHDSRIEAVDAKLRNGPLIAGNLALRDALEIQLNIAENADETGYVTDVGFIDLDKEREKARALLSSPSPGQPMLDELRRLRVAVAAPQPPADSAGDPCVGQPFALRLKPFNGAIGFVGEDGRLVKVNDAFRSWTGDEWLAAHPGKMPVTLFPGTPDEPHLPPAANSTP